MSTQKKPSSIEKTIVVYRDEKQMLMTRFTSSQQAFASASSEQTQRSLEQSILLPHTGPLQLLLFTLPINLSMFWSNMRNNMAGTQLSWPLLSNLDQRWRKWDTPPPNQQNVRPKCNCSKGATMRAYDNFFQSDSDLAPLLPKRVIPTNYSVPESKCRSCHCPCRHRVTLSGRVVKEAGCQKMPLP